MTIEQTLKLFDNIKETGVIKVSLGDQEVNNHEDKRLLTERIIKNNLQFQLDFNGNEENLLSKITKFNREYQQRFNDYDLLKDICDELINSSYYSELRNFLAAYAITYENLQSTNLEGISLSIIEFIYGSNMDLSALSREEMEEYKELQNLRCFNISKHFINSGSVEQLKLFLLNNDIKVLKFNLDELNLAETLELFKIITETKIINQVYLMTDKPLPEELLMIVYSNKSESLKDFYLNDGDGRDNILHRLGRHIDDSVSPISSSRLFKSMYGYATTRLMEDMANMENIADENYTCISKICYMMLKAGYYDTLKNFLINNNIIELGLSSFEPLTYGETTKLFEIISQVPKMNLQIIH
ncbi:hypothetical protein [Candidatus Trichorickettsia mobilis]|uniref:hypothetical protein n=1 Tax=Candidatus Trichorickettsia mobilis TaxID=1346319 RepID=UPI00292CD6D6|nr:hypothetical protein [Candidatus Trichorickettsia mobilis]